MFATGKRDRQPGICEYVGDTKLTHLGALTGHGFPAHLHCVFANPAGVVGFSPADTRVCAASTLALPTVVRTHRFVPLRLIGSLFPTHTLHVEKNVEAFFLGLDTLICFAIRTGCHED